MTFLSLAGGKTGTTAGLEFKKQLEACEELERQLLPVFINEVVESIEAEQEADPKDSKQLMPVIKMKDNAARTMQLMTAMARYSGLKRGTLPRELGIINSPRNEMEEAQRKVAEIRERMRAR